MAKKADKIHTIITFDPYGSWRDEIRPKKIGTKKTSIHAHNLRPSAGQQINRTMTSKKGK